METKEIHSFINDNFKSLYQYLDKRFDGMDSKFDNVDKRFDQQDLNIHQDVVALLKQIETKLDNSEQKFELKFLSAKVDQIEKQLFKMQNS